VVAGGSTCPAGVGHCHSTAVAGAGRNVVAGTAVGRVVVSSTRRRRLGPVVAGSTLAGGRAMVLGCTLGERPARHG
jgi:hypothetical protein